MTERAPQAVDLRRSAECLHTSASTVDADTAVSYTLIATLLDNLTPIVERLEEGDMAGAMAMLAMHGNPFAPAAIEGTE